MWNSYGFAWTVFTAGWPQRLSSEETVDIVSVFLVPHLPVIVQYPFSSLFLYFVVYVWVFLSKKIHMIEICSICIWKKMVSILMCFYSYEFKRVFLFIYNYIDLFKKYLNIGIFIYFLNHKWLFYF